MHVVDGAGGERGRGGGEHGRLGDAEPDLLALHAAHGLIQADLCQSRVALELRPVAHAQADQEDDTHGQEDRAALPAVDGRRQAVVLQAGALLSSARRQLAGGFAAGQRLVAGGILLLAAAHHLAEGDDAGAGEEHHGVQLDHVRDDRGVLQRGGGVCAQEAAAVGAQVLDDLKCGDGTHGDGLEGALQCIHHDVGVEVLGHALPHQQQAAHDGERQQQAGGDAGQVGEEVAHVVLGLSGQPADERDAGSVAAGGRDEHHEDDDQHLA